MSEAPALTADPDEGLLDELAGMLTSAARMAHERIAAAQDDAAFNAAGQTLHRMARSLRQTLALKAKLKREREQAPRQDAPPKKPGGATIARRIRELREAALRVIWDEAEDPETADWHTHALDELVTEGMLQDGFAAEPLDDHVARVCLEIGLAPERIERWRDLPDPPPADGREPDWRSSA